jgi:hypothetical protein
MMDSNQMAAKGLRSMKSRDLQINVFVDPEKAKSLDPGLDPVFFTTELKRRKKYSTLPSAFLYLGLKRSLNRVWKDPQVANEDYER